MAITPKIEGPEQERRAELVSRVFNGIQPTCEAFYLHSISYSTNSCLGAFSRYDAYTKAGEAAYVLIGALQEAIGHASALSRYFWPSPFRNKKKPFLEQMIADRGKRLRTAFGLTESSALFNRDLRNAWEHFDEKLDIFLLDTIAGTFFPGQIVGSLSKAHSPTNHFFKFLDPVDECLVLLGKRYYFVDIRDEVTRIDLIAKDADMNGARLPQYEP